MLQSIPKIKKNIKTERIIISYAISCNQSSTLKKLWYHWKKTHKNFLSKIAISAIILILHGILCSDFIFIVWVVFDGITQQCNQLPLWWLHKQTCFTVTHDRWIFIIIRNTLPIFWHPVDDREFPPGICLCTEFSSIASYFTFFEFLPHDFWFSAALYNWQ